MVWRPKPQLPRALLSASARPPRPTSSGSATWKLAWWNPTAGDLAKAKNVPEARALDHVFGYCVANDVSARDWQFHSPTFTMGKSFDTHGPIGPWIVTADEVADPQSLTLRCFVNGELRQESNTGFMIHSLAAQIAYLSAAFTLEPGDLIATGTPEGVGVGREPPVFLRAGDVIRCEIEGIGAIENSVAQN